MWTLQVRAGCVRKFTKRAPGRTNRNSVDPKQQYNINYERVRGKILRILKTYIKKIVTALNVNHIKIVQRWWQTFEKLRQAYSENLGSLNHQSQRIWSTSPTIRECMVWWSFNHNKTQFYWWKLLLDFSNDPLSSLKCFPVGSWHARSAEGVSNLPPDLRVVRRLGEGLGCLTLSELRRTHLTCAASEPRCMHQ